MCIGDLQECKLRISFIKQRVRDTVIINSNHKQKTPEYIVNKYLLSKRVKV